MYNSYHNYNERRNEIAFSCSEFTVQVIGTGFASPERLRTSICSEIDSLRSELMGTMPASYSAPSSFGSGYMMPITYLGQQSVLTVDQNEARCQIAFSEKSLGIELQLVWSFGQTKSAAMFPDGLAASLSTDGVVRVWESRTGQLVNAYQGRDAYHSLAALHDGYLAVGCESGIVDIYDPVDFRLVQTISAHQGAVTYLEASNNRLVSSSYGSVKIWNPYEAGSPVLLMDLVNFNIQARGTRLKIISDDHMIICESQSEHWSIVSTWSINQSMLVKQFQIPIGTVIGVLVDTPNCAGFMSFNGSVSIYEVFSGILHKTVEIGEGLMSMVGFSWPFHFAAYLRDIEIWNTTTHRRVKTISTGQTSVITTLGLSADRRTLSVGFADNTVQVWSITTQ